MPYAFGKDIERWYYPLIDDAVPATLLTSQTPAIYVFDSQPSRTAAIAGTGAVQTVASWTWDAGKSGWYYTVTAIDDPTPESTVDIRTYWEAVNFRLQTSAQVQTVLRAFDLQRVSGHASAVAVTDTLLRSFFPQLDTCSTESQRLAYVPLGIDSVKSKLRAKGYRWAQVTYPDRVTNSVAYWVLYMIMLVQIQSGNDKYEKKYLEYKKLFEDTTDALVLEYDADKDGQPDTEVRADSGPVFLVR